MKRLTIAFLAVLVSTHGCMSSEVPKQIRIGLGEGLCRDERREPVQWVLADARTDLDGIFEIIGGVPTGVRDFVAFKAAQPFGLFLTRNGTDTLIAVIREKKKVEPKNPIPGGILQAGDVLLLRSGELGIERAKRMEKHRVKASQ